MIEIKKEDLDAIIARYTNKPIPTAPEAPKPLTEKNVAEFEVNDAPADLDAQARLAFIAFHALHGIIYQEDVLWLSKLAQDLIAANRRERKRAADITRFMMEQQRKKDMRNSATDPRLGRLY